MSDNTGNVGGVVSLPQGGGAMKGIGETFSPDLHTGTGNFSVPIALPPGRNGFQPKISLAYSTGNGNGPFGLGWTLSIPGVSRKTSKGIPVYDDQQDTFLLSGAEDLVPVPGAPQGAQRYRPRTEGLFAHIDHHRPDAQNDYWEVRGKDGLTSIYGTPGQAGQDPGTVANPEHRGQVFAWKLTRTTDPYGNRIEYSYARDATPREDRHYWDQLYLSEIRYVDFGDPANPAFLVAVRFSYGDRPDHFSDYRAGYEVRTVRRCDRIDIFTNPGTETLTRTYHFDYVDQDATAPSGHTPNGVSLLAGIRVEGHDGDASEWLPPLTFGYTRFAPDSHRAAPITGSAIPQASLGNPDFELVDLFGNGLPHVLQMNGVVRYWRNLGGSRFDRPRPMPDAPAGFGLADPGVQLLDANGDGRSDLLVTRDGLAGYFPATFGGTWDRRAFQRYAEAPSFNLKDPEVHLVDLDGDGVTDAIRSGARLECFYNDRDAGWTRTQVVERLSLDVFPNVSFADERVKWADMTGDGMQDIVLIHNGNLSYWPSLGHGRWASRVQTRNAPHFPTGYNPRRILLGDVDGDGLADLVYVDNRKVMLWINRSGNGWSDPITITGTPTVADIDSVRLADMLGNGVSGLLWSADARGNAHDSMFFLDFLGGIKPYLLSEIDNHVGTITRTEYAPSTEFYRQDEADPGTRWLTPLPFPVHVVKRVEVLDALSGGKLTTEYRYHHGYWDGAEREFRGFGMVDQLDTESFSAYNAPGLHNQQPVAVPSAHLSPPTLTRTWFHQGPVGAETGDWRLLDYTPSYWPEDPPLFPAPQDQPEVQALLQSLPGRARRDAWRSLRGSILRTELYALDGSARYDRPYTVTESQYGFREVDAPPSTDGARRHIFFPYMLAKRTTQWERGADPMTSVTVTGDYDDYGQPRAQINIAVPRGRDYRVGIPPDRPAPEPYLATHTVTAYALHDDAAAYIVDRAASTTTFEVRNDGRAALLDLANQIAGGAFDKPEAIIGATRRYYDGPAFTGAPLGQLGYQDAQSGTLHVYGALVRTETLAATEATLQAAYPSDDPFAATAPFFSTGALTWPQEYPASFRQVFPTAPTADPTRPEFTTVSILGYGTFDGKAFYSATERRAYDFQQSAGGSARGLVRARRDALSHDTTLVYDNFDLLPASATDPAGLTTVLQCDYRVLQPWLVTDPNGNRTAYQFTPLGLVSGIALSGKDGEQQGDIIQTDTRRIYPSTFFAYHFDAFDGSEPGQPQPIFVRTLKRLHHTWDEAASAGQTPLDQYFTADEPDLHPERFIESREYWDGTGRTLQSRAQAEDLIFDDPALAQPRFGRSGLTADQSQNGDAVGRLGSQSAPNVVVSGWQVYDNKGRPVEKYEPFFATGWDYAPQPDAERGQKAVMYYDPRGHVVRTVNPDGSEQRVVYGVPGTIAAPNLADPSVFEPTPWESYTYDANDNAGRTHHDQALGYQHHWDTPQSALLDALGRTVVAVHRNRAAAGQPVEEHRTVSTYDIRGNVLTVTDPLGRVVFRHSYDLADHTLRTWQLDAGIRRSVVDAAGNTVERRDSKGALVLRSYDALHRPLRGWARDDGQSLVSLCESFEYGDAVPQDQWPARRAANLLGRPLLQHDPAGLLGLDAYDFKGNLLQKSRRVIADSELQALFADAGTHGWAVPRFAVQWENGDADAICDPTRYQTNLEYDALNCVTCMVYPQSVDDNRQELVPHYNRAGALQSVELSGTPYVRHIAYNAKRQRLLVAYGNGVMTRYAYDPQTFRLARLRSESYTVNSDGTVYHPSGSPLQDLAYSYDLSGNILTVRDRTPGSGVANSPEGPDALTRAFAYNPLYRLTSATGRESNTIPSPRPWSDDRRQGFNSPNHGSANQDNAPSLTRLYGETYAYDPAGNLVAMQHGNDWTRRFGFGGMSPQDWAAAWPTHLDGTWDNAPGNRLTHALDDTQTSAATHAYDPNGNLISETTSRHFAWDAGDQLQAFWVQPAGSTAEPSTYALYLYDGSGRRVKKFVRAQGGAVETTVYIDGNFEHHNRSAGSQANNTLHVMDNQERIALVRVGPAFTDAQGKALDQGPDVQYHLGDHLASSVVVVDASGSWVNREEYFPHGETSFGSFARKRYRFTGKERDEESGLAYHGARYYAPWLARWTSCDPLGYRQGLNLFAYAHGNPINRVDTSGLADEPPKVNQVEPARPGPGERYSIAPHGEHPPAVERTGGQNLQGHHPHQQQWAKSNVAGYEGTEAPSQLLETKGNPNPELRGEHTKISTMQNAERPANGDWTSRSTSEAFEQAREEYVEGGLLKKVEGGYEAVPGKQGAQAVLESEGHLFSLNDLKVTDESGTASVIKNGRFEQNMAEAEMKSLTQAGHEVKTAAETAAKEGAAVAGKEALKEGAGTALKETVKIGTEKVAKFVPFLGIAVGVYLVQKDIHEGDYGAATWDTLEAIPVVGDVVGAGHLGWAGGTALNNWLFQ